MRWTDLTGLFLLSQHLTEHNAEALLPLCRGKSRRELERLIAAWFPRTDVPPKVQALGEARAGEATGNLFPQPIRPARANEVPCSRQVPRRRDRESSRSLPTAF